MLKSLLNKPLQWAAAVSLLTVSGFLCWNLAASHDAVKAQKGAVGK